MLINTHKFLIETLLSPYQELWGYNEYTPSFKVYKELQRLKIQQLFMVFLILDICGITNYSRNIDIEKSSIYYDSKLASMFLGKLDTVNLTYLP